jgi:hypothetical protein
LITVRPHGGGYGYFSSERSGSRDGKQNHDETLNIRHFEKRSPCEILSPSRNGYHREWAELMERVGLVPSDTGAPGGKTRRRRNPIC